MRKLTLFILLTLLLLPCWADNHKQATRSPASVVQQLYKTHLATQNLIKTVQKDGKCFTPGFRIIIVDALKKAPQNSSNFVDVDFLINSQTELGDFEVLKTTEIPKKKEPDKALEPEWTVEVRVWTGLNSRKSAQDKSKRDSWPYVFPARFYLIDVGEGPQIREIEWVEHEVIEDGQKETQPAFWVRPWLDGIAKGK